MPRLLDYAAYLELPETRRRYDIVDGVLKYMSPLLHEQIDGGPDLVVEVVAPGNTPKHIQQKLRDHAAAGVPEAWVAYPKRKSIAVLHPHAGEFRERLRSKTLPGLSFLVRKAFA